MGLAWEAVLGERFGVTGADLVDRVVSMLVGMGFVLDDPGVPLTSIAAAIGTDKKRMLSDVSLPLPVAPGRCELRLVPLAEIRRELPSVRAEIADRMAGIPPRPGAQRSIRESSGDSNFLDLDGDTYEIRPVESEKAAEEVSILPGVEELPPPAPPVQAIPQDAGPEDREAPEIRTVTLAELYWSQGERDTARRIVEGILREDPWNARARAWLASRPEPDPVEGELREFLENMAKEYGHELS